MTAGITIGRDGKDKSGSVRACQHTRTNTHTSVSASPHPATKTSRGSSSLIQHLYIIHIICIRVCNKRHFACFTPDIMRHALDGIYHFFPIIFTYFITLLSLKHSFLPFTSHFIGAAPPREPTLFKSLKVKSFY